MVTSTKNDDDDDEVKWVTHYSSNHRILLVGDGDFSFSLCLGRSFDSAFNIVSTSLDSHDEVIKKYKKARSNLSELHGLGASILHGVDVTKMKFHPDLMNRRFDRIVFNFPHAGFRGRECDTRVIGAHRNLVCNFFSNAKSMLLPDGEIHVSHKTTGPFSDWNLEGLARSNSLVLVEQAKFKIEDYPKYQVKRGDGRGCDRSFPYRKSSTFKFRLCPTLYKNTNSSLGSCHRSPEPFQAPPRPTSSKFELVADPIPRLIRRSDKRITLPEFSRRSSHRRLNRKRNALPDLGRTTTLRSVIGK